MSVTEAIENAEATEATTPAIYLRISNLWKSFGDFQALKDISLEIFDGEFVCFLGPSGCGKTTLLRAIAGLDLQTSGRVEQGGRDISVLPPAQRDFGIVFQSYALFPNLTIRKNIAFGLESAGRSKAAIAARVTELLNLVGLADHSEKYPSQLSGGEQQRIALARAIATSPGLLLLDEPLSALDAKVRVRLRHEIKELQRQLGITTVMVTHDQEEALSMADRIVVMNHGVIEQVGTPTEIYREPKTLFVADFIGETNKIDARSAGPDSLTFGGMTLGSMAHGFAEGAEVLAVIRPEDVIPHEAGYRREGNGPEDGGRNVIDVIIDEMEFLGSFWRSRLGGPQLGGIELMADLSINAVRRLALAEGGPMTIELPAERLMAFTRGGGDERHG